MMDEGILPSKESNLDIKVEVQLNKSKYINIVEKKLEIKPNKTFSVENSITGTDDKIKLFNLNKSEDNDDEKMEVSISDLGGRLTFFREGKPLLELSHRTEKGSWIQVKSKTYWPPSTTAKTTTQLKNGSSLWSASDDRSNNSSACNDHLRKQVTPKRAVSQSSEMYWYSNKHSNHHRLKLRRNPFHVLYSNNCNKHLKHRKITRSTLKEKLHYICERLGCNIEYSLTINALCENWKTSFSDKESVQSPRKRLLKYVNGEKEGHSRKKPYSGNVSQRTCDRAAGASLQVGNKGMSSYSIDSLLNNDSGNRTESFLRNLLKCDSKETESNLRNCSVHEPQRKGQNWFEANKVSGGRGSKNVPPVVPPGLSNYYLPYLTPNYMVMPQFYPTTQPTAEMATMVAAAINLQNSSLLPPASLEASYRAANLHSPQSKVPSRSSSSPQPRTLNRASPISPQPRTFNRVSDSPQPRVVNHGCSNSPQPRASSLVSPHSISSSPNSKHLYNSHLTNMSSYIGLLNSPTLSWPPSTSNSPPKLSTSAVSPPPQDAPLNLSKRKEKG